MIAAEAVRLAAAVLTLHQRQSAQHCLCGWGELGESHAEHQARELLNAGLLNAARSVA